MGRPVVARYRGTHHFQLIEVETLKISAKVATATFVIVDENSDEVDVAIQFVDGLGVDMAVASCISWYLSSDAAGQVIASAPSGGIAIDGDGLLQEFTTNVAGLMTSEADGDVAVTITDTATRDMYLNLVMPDGAIVTSGTLAFST